jgi:LEA14-like dessication related protein
MNRSQKKPKRKFILISTLLFVLALGGVIAYYVYNPKKAISFVFPDLNNISYVNAVIKNDSAFIDISLVLQNKNPYKLNIDTIVFDLKLADTLVAKQTMSLNIKQSRFDEDTVKLPLNLKVRQMMRLIQSLQKQDSTTLEVSGYIVYETIFGRAKVALDKKLKIETPVPPKIKVLKVEREGFSLKDRIMKVNASIEIINKGKRLSLELSDVNYEMTVKETLHTKGTYAKTIVVKPQSTVVISIPMDIEIYHPLKTAMKIITNKDRMNYRLHLKFNVTEHVSEKSLTSPAEITATGELELKK